MTITTAGIIGITKVLSDDAPYIAIGTGTTESVRSDTQLETETVRKLATAVIHDGLNIEIRGFFTNAELPTRAREWGVFIGGATDKENSGYLLGRVLFDFTKGAADLILIYDGNIAPA